MNSSNNLKADSNINSYDIFKKRLNSINLNENSNNLILSNNVFEISKTIETEIYTDKSIIDLKADQNIKIIQDNFEIVEISHQDLEKKIKDINIENLKLVDSSQGNNINDSDNPIKIEKLNKFFNKENFTMEKDKGTNNTELQNRINSNINSETYECQKNRVIQSRETWNNEKNNINYKKIYNGKENNYISNYNNVILTKTKDIVEHKNAPASNLFYNCKFNNENISLLKL